MTSKPNNRARILVVEDDDAIRESLADGLGLDGYEVRAVDGVGAARRDLERHRADLILLDLNLPDDSGYTLIREIRERGLGASVDPGVAVVMVSGRSLEVDRVRAFELGCDDYVVKPFSFTELRGRIAAVLRRADSSQPVVQAVGELVIDRRTRRVTVAGQQIKLTLKEYALLLALAEDPHRVFSREQLLGSVWGYRSRGSTRTLDAHACRLRRKLSVGCEIFVCNSWGVGYRLTPGVDEAKGDDE